MEKWEKALHKFLKEWIDRNDVIAALVCGSYVTGNPTKRSDIDVHILLSDEANWRERGNKQIDKYLIEYFVNPPRQIRQYFQEDFRDHRTMSMVQFLTGQVLFDKTGVIEELKREAQEWINKKHEKPNYILQEIKKYGIWDTCDNLQDCYEQQSPDFYLIYYHSLSNLFNQYCLYLGLELIPPYQILSYLKNTDFKEKYLKDTFPDTEFSNMFIKAIEQKENLEMINNYKQLSKYVLDKMGGFDIDGWKIISSVEI
ncbi:DNA polymerase [Bacillus sp. SA1-12]|uniref:nucleotidyltransferase domain-containing protein n=1 Tax=Bacillus sp. SA1-12 TaxID=1455638 RepID=UPI0006270270|nr:nucleotidyltransferase domain-containing protein [Bacillus sp. SA1-12]KKI90074.1 DNA polymerase [Bacillus sp. SA1-12]